MNAHRSSTLIVGFGAFAIFLIVIAFAALIYGANTMNTDPTAASARARLADGGKNT